MNNYQVMTLPDIVRVRDFLLNNGFDLPECSVGPIPVVLVVSEAIQEYGYDIGFKIVKLFNRGECKSIRFSCINGERYIDVKCIGKSENDISFMNFLKDDKNVSDLENIIENVKVLH